MVIHNIVGTVGSLDIGDYPNLGHTDSFIFEFSKICGAISIVLWLFAQPFQIMRNFYQGSVGSMPGEFWAVLFVGDILSTVESILLKLPRFDVFLGLYYCVVDMILLLQHFFYWRRGNNDSNSQIMYSGGKGSAFGLSSRRIVRPSNPIFPTEIDFQSNANSRNVHLDHTGGASKATLIYSGMFNSVSGVAVDLKGAPTSSFEMIQRSMDGSFSHFLTYSWHMIFWGLGRKRPTIEKVASYLEWANQVSYASSLIYLWIKIHRTQSVKGISVYLFLFTMTGTLFYVTSEFSNLYLVYKYDFGSFDKLFETRLIAIFGSFFSVLLDSLILYQFWSYGSSEKYAKKSNSSYTNTHIYPSETCSEDLLSPSKHISDTHNLGFQHPDWYTRTKTKKQRQLSHENSNYNEYSFREHDSRSQTAMPDSDEHSHLLSRHHDCVSACPPQHYILGSSINSDNLHDMHNRASFFAKLTRSIPKSNRGLESMRNNSAQSLAAIFRTSGKLFSSESSPLDTSLIPSLIGSYSSVSKKMADDSKIPFSPSDFLQNGGSTN